jgi:hypothetical protein
MLPAGSAVAHPCRLPNGASPFDVVGSFQSSERATYVGKQRLPLWVQVCTVYDAVEHGNVVLSFCFH